MDEVFVINTERGFYAGFVGYGTGHLTFLFSQTLGQQKLHMRGPMERGATTFADRKDAEMVATSMQRFGIVIRADVLPL